MGNNTGGAVYEYGHISVPTTAVQNLVAKLNDLAADGWELVSSHSADKTLGLNEVTALLRRAIVPLPPLVDTEAGWYRDPAGRWQVRYWTGDAWTFNVGRDGKQHRDPPTARTPTQGLTQ